MRRLRSSFVGVHHLLAHALVAQLSHPHLSFPFLALIVSGGHTESWLVLGPTRVLILGQTMDDAMGEALDKAARLLAIERGEQEAPGAALERTAQQADAASTPASVTALPPLPLPLSRHAGCDFSFAGLKTALAARVATLSRNSSAARLTAAESAHLACAFQSTCCAHIVQRTLRALAFARQSCPQLRQLVLAGGVACNGALRQSLTAAMREQSVELCIPPPALCGDNGVMIAWMGAVQAGLGHEDALELSHQPQWPAGRRLHIA